ncbi:MAG: hypothetical protein BME94_01425 [Methanobacteriales archaeon Met13]
MKFQARNIGLIAGLILVLFLSIGALSAHQPRLDTGTTFSVENPILVENPEISQAFYGQLKGNPVYYQIKSDNPFQLYVNLLVPTRPGQGGEFISAEMTDASGKVIIFLNGTKSTWEQYFEEFGGDYYLKGPEATLQVPAGTYNIKVFNTLNQGKYAIAIGKIETFPANEAITALFTLPLLKEQFFAKPLSTLLVEFVGIILGLGSLMVLFILMVKSRKSEEMTDLTLKVGATLAPLLRVGTIITTMVWAWVMYNNPLNILGLLNSSILVMILLLTWMVGSKTMKAEFGKLPLISASLLGMLWWIFVFLAIAVI